MGPKGIEPLPPSCGGGILPLDYGPVLRRERIELS